MLYKYLLKLNIKCYVIFICFFLINILQAQDCSSLRKPNETYGAGEGKDVSWCNMQNPTAYTDCMCEQEKSQKVSAVEQQNLQKQALNKSTEASALYQQASNLVTQANLDKDPSKLDEAKALYQQAITLSNQAKGFIEQAYAGSDASYNRLKNLYLEQYNKQIAWATTGIEGIPNQKDRIKAETNQKQITLNPKKSNTANNWDLSTEAKAENSWAGDDEPIEMQSKKTESVGVESWTQEETLNWIENNMEANAYKKGDKANHELITSKSTIILKNTWYAEPSNGNPGWVYEKSIIPIDCFKGLNLIALGTNKLYGGEQIFFEFTNECVKQNYDGIISNTKVKAFYVNIGTFNKLSQKRIAEVFLHLAILNGADKNNIEIRTNP
ncbi:hypothetical protein [Xanthomarina gelatinilytica]|uniref:hypothetical protein n=1 Tax=Xanthomarina gelatinilytica TaxID=1137281 RepID=UPI003AA8668E